MKVKGTVKAWTTGSFHDFDEIAELSQKGKNDAAIGGMQFTHHDMSKHPTWIEVGIATITVEFFSREAIVSKQIEGLREQLRQHRVNAENAEQAILSQISNLMAITG